jgi:ABC-type transporter Mla subunit MlaD
VEIDSQIIFNAVLSITGFLGGWVLNNMSKAITNLETQDKALVEKVQNIEVLVAGAYVKKTDLEKLADDIFALLHRIEDKLDKKADK